ncbi:PREDICTED: ribosome biogenesis regulatory protein homolog isoform X2 [Cyphomyrmex costatus]|uniref:ribosome biogenesis regulatory protein homolog isoform X2 n=1 Tax=Cyphomyrmex costatus TaxID=456900 RepID=UPI0008522F3E|nr:PREDICTED: ribosome biogenesis regulatory protein homolog isoform X2 [Cyphomyrmex costatus]
MDIVKSILEKDEGKEDLSKSTEKNIYNTCICRSQSNSYLKNLTRDNVQLLINKIWELPIERVDEAIVAKLPKPDYVLPRSRVIPKPKPLTKWQQFAKEKGIRTKKKGKSKLKWDEILKKWIPTHGYKRATAEEQKEWLIEAKDNSTDDPFAKVKTAKQERQSKNELQRLRNIAKSKNIKLPSVGLPTREHFSSSQQLSKAATVAHTSTASIGKFQSRIQQPIKINKKRKGALKTKTSKSAKKPKAGKGKRDLHKKVGGRKRR